MNYRIVTCLIFILCALPNTSYANDININVKFLQKLAQRESGLRKNIVNRFGYLGYFQMGGQSLVDAGFYMLGKSKNMNSWDGQFTDRAGFVDVTSKTTFLEHAGAQELAVRKYHQLQYDRISRLGLDASIGKTINGIKITKSGLIAGSHLMGVGGVARFIRSNGLDNPSDGNDVPVSKYIEEFSMFF